MNASIFSGIPGKYIIRLEVERTEGEGIIKDLKEKGVRIEDPYNKLGGMK